jgi:hypothetical protein
MAQVQDELERIVSLPTHRLRIEWRRYLRSEPPRRLSRDQLLRAVTYKMQERVYGSLTQAAKKTLRDLAAKITAEGVNGALSCRRRSNPACVWCASGGGRCTACLYSRMALSTTITAIGH